MIALSGGEIVYFEMDQVGMCRLQSLMVSSGRVGCGPSWSVVGVSAEVPCAVVKLHGCVCVYLCSPC